MFDYQIFLFTKAGTKTIFFELEMFSVRY